MMITGIMMMITRIIAAAATSQLRAWPPLHLPRFTTDTGNVHSAKVTAVPLQAGWLVTAARESRSGGHSGMRHERDTNPSHNASNHWSWIIGLLRPT